MKPFAKQRGLSLIELMIALVLSATLLWGVLQIFDGNRNTMQMQTAFARVQESGRFATDLLTKEIRMADYWGCAPDKDSIQNHLDPADPDYSGSSAKELYDQIGADGVSGIDNASGIKLGAIDVLDGTDTLTLRGADDACAGTGRMVPSIQAAALHVSAQCDVHPGDIVLLTNCQSGELMTITSVQGEGGCNTTGGDSNSNSDKKTITHNTGSCNLVGAVNNATKALQREYGADARILKPYQKTYFVAASSVSGEFSLYVTETGSAAMELVPGVEDMQVFYGRDTDDDEVVDTWSSSAGLSAAQMEQVIAIKVQLVAASDSNVRADGFDVIDLDGVTTTYSDGKLRKVYLTTAKVRNRGRL
ncbi:PilW family protein [Microbulbifer pacificus]|uniref:PilW family protein n=1 Tax=Microbulbifer pacificus TaxID=407164 RepID=A0AAU0N4V9_9GAMM|nr:PilW family protein [Microbulbifer pacificus]WOX07276.1 PilW family protein [Microbulbifer pacificus]